MKKLFSIQSVMVVLVMAAVMMLACIFHAKANAEKWENRVVTASVNRKAAYDKMLSAEEECFWQAMRLYNELQQEDGANELISEPTKTLMKNNLPSLEYYKAAIDEMSDNIEDFEDRFDDCDYRISLKNAIDAELAYQSANAKYEYLLNE